MNGLTRLLALALALCLTLSSVALAEFEGVERAAEYLTTYYNAPDLSGRVTAEMFNDALVALGQEPIEEFTPENAFVAAIRLAGLEELALTYIPDESRLTLEDNRFVGVLDEEYLPYVACGIALDLSDARRLDEVDYAELLYRAAETSGMCRRFIGRTMEENILTEVKSVLDSFALFEQEDLIRLGDELVLRGAAIDYSLRYSGSNANFLPEYTMRYSHDNPQHILQLIGMLKGQNFDAYIQLEPRVCVYEYLPEWGEPGEPTATRFVRQTEDGRYLCYAVEYDLVVEFINKNLQEAIHGYVELYARRFENYLEAEGIHFETQLVDSWWYPLYFSTTQQEREKLDQLVDNIVYDADGAYSLHAITRHEDVPIIAGIVAEVAPDLAVVPQEIYVSPTFPQYITSSDGRAANCYRALD